MQLTRAAILATVAVAGSASAAPPPRLVLPQVAVPLTCDGELEELAWRTPARTGPFTAPGGGDAAPYSDARFLRDDRFLYIALYAADENIRSSDEFTVRIGAGSRRRTLRFTADGKLSPAIPGAQVGVDRDGSLDDPKDDDEEWVIEAALPLGAVPFARDGSVPVTVSRCDVTRDGATHCGSWTGALARR